MGSGYNKYAEKILFFAVSLLNLSEGDGYLPGVGLSFILLCTSSCHQLGIPVVNFSGAKLCTNECIKDPFEMQQSLQIV